MVWWYIYIHLHMYMYLHIGICVCIYIYIFIFICICICSVDTHMRHMVCNNISTTWLKTSMIGQCAWKLRESVYLPVVVSQMIPSLWVYPRGIPSGISGHSYWTWPIHHWFTKLKMDIFQVYVSFLEGITNAILLEKDGGFNKAMRFITPWALDPSGTICVCGC